MAETNLGRVAIVPKGTYSASIQYYYLDLVFSDGNTYVAISDPPVGTSPTNATYWQLVATGGSPKGVYANLAALQAAFPTGTTGIYITSDNGHWYFWSGSAWTDGGVYQGPVNNVVQTTGTSETDVMSQKAVTDIVSEAKNTDAADFAIADKAGRAIVVFKNGHIKTKNFNSENLTPTLPLNGKKYSILGDSISTFQGYLASDAAGYDGTAYAHFYPQFDILNVAQTWWRKMEAITGLSLLKNCSWSGSEVCGNSTSTASAEVGCSTRRVTDIGSPSPDVIIVYMGTNDMSNYVSYDLGNWSAVSNEIPAEGTIILFSNAFALMLKKLIVAHPTSEIYCCSILDCSNADFESTSFPVINSRGKSTMEYNSAIQNIALGLGAHFIDLHNCGINYWTLATYTGDNVHPNEAGAELISKKISTSILSQTKLIY